MTSLSHGKHLAWSRSWRPGLTLGLAASDSHSPVAVACLLSCMSVHALQAQAVY